ncbi:family 16 glycoside hydrolase, partial [Bacteroidota bacterium]
NKYRIEAIGDSIKTWINDVPAAFLVDSKTKSGFIGLQVHGIGRDSSKIGLSVRWRNIRIITEEPHKYLKKSPLKPLFFKEK